MRGCMVCTVLVLRSAEGTLLWCNGHTRQITAQTVTHSESFVIVAKADFYML